MQRDWEIKRDILEWEDESDGEDDQNKKENGETDSNSLSSNPTKLPPKGSNCLSSNPTESPPNEPNTYGELNEGRGKRERRSPWWMKNYETGKGLSEEENLNVMMEENLNAMMMITENDPVSFEEAMKSKNWREWMSKEIEAIEKNQTWELTVLPKGVKPIGVKWVFKTKLNEDGNMEKLKARLVEKGYGQRHGIDYTKVFALVARLDIIRVILAMAAQFNWEIFQLDVKSAFLHGEDS